MNGASRTSISGVVRTPIKLGRGDFPEVSPATGEQLRGEPRLMLVPRESEEVLRTAVVDEFGASRTAPAPTNEAVASGQQLRFDV
jgi:hypothetical protein